MKKTYQPPSILVVMLKAHMSLCNYTVDGYQKAATEPQQVGDIDED